MSDFLVEFTQVPAEIPSVTLPKFNIAPEKLPSQ